jgi:hypothetical protein
MSANVTASQPNYAELGAALDELELGVDAAEYHGGICGALCALGSGASNSWLRATRSSEIADPDLTNTLLNAEATAWKALAGPDFEFHPVLPEGEVSLSARVDALALWCQGFLSGLGLGGENVATVLAAPASPSPKANGQGRGGITEILADLAEISKARLGDEDMQDAAQAGFDLEALVEYVRVGVQLIFDELEGRRAAAESPAASAHGK